jgi:prepilin-type processing-associated H-X9-DG protein
MPEPFVVAAVDDPPLPITMRHELPAKSRVYACPGDIDCVYARCGISYIYNTMLAGKRIEDSMLRKRLNMAVRDIPVAWDYDGQAADPATGQPAIPFFHLKRNLLFADSHVGEYHVAPDGP